MRSNETSVNARVQSELRRANEYSAIGDFGNRDLYLRAAQNKISTLRNR